ncbi:hypothetical protein ACP6EK_03935 [Candidatus Caldatribacterium sp. SIUC1]
MWQVTAKGSLPLGQSEEEEAFLEKLREFLPEDRKVVLLAD